MTDATEAFTGGKYAMSVKRAEAKRVAGRLIPDGGEAQPVQMLQDGAKLLR